MIEVVAYNPSWVDQFEELRRWYEPMLLGVDVLSIEHVGSTSVPGLATNTYLIVEDSLALRNHLLLRQVLRESPELRREYAVFKRQLAASVIDIGEYASFKTEIIHKILKYGGMDDDSLRLIKDQNK